MAVDFVGFIGELLGYNEMLAGSVGSALGTLLMTVGDDVGTLRRCVVVVNDASFAKDGKALVVGAVVLICCANVLGDSSVVLLGASLVVGALVGL